MRGEELLNSRSVARSELTGQTQSRERNHARVSLEFFSKPRGGTLFLRLGSELQRIGLILIHAEFCLEHGDDELARRVVVVEQNDFVQARPFRLQTNLGARLGGDVGHCSSTFRSSAPFSHVDDADRRIAQSIASPPALIGTAFFSISLTTNFCR